MNAWRIQRFGGVVAWALLSAVAVFALTQSTLAERQDAFDVDARIAHRLLSQRAAQHDAVLATLALSQPGHSATAPTALDPADMRALGGKLNAVYPQILAVERRAGTAPWEHGGPAFEQAETVSQQLGRPVLAALNVQTGDYWLVHAAVPYSYALHINAHAMVPQVDWPLPSDSPVRVVLDMDGQRLVLHPGHAVTSPWHFLAKKRLAAPSQPLDVVLDRYVAWSELPWIASLLATLAIALGLWGLAVLLRQQSEKRRAEHLLRLGQVARLNTLGELAAGMAHELNQPLTAVLANTQAVARLLHDEPVDLPVIHAAMDQAVQQARRASEVVSRLRRTVERPDMAAPQQDLDLVNVVRHTLDLLEPELLRCQVKTHLVLQGQAPSAGTLPVRTDPVALEQIIHNLLMNALQAMENVPAEQRQLTVTLSADAGVEASARQAHVVIRDTGPGIPPESLPRLFEPFFTTREGGLGLGLSLCETLARGLDATLVARNAASRGAEFQLTLPMPRANLTPTSA